MIQDAAGQFADIRFKIGVLSDIMSGPVGLPPDFVTALDTASERYDRELMAVLQGTTRLDYDVKYETPFTPPAPSPEVMRLIADFRVPQEALDSVHSLSCEAGGPGYQWVDADGGDWGGTDERFDIQDVSGFQLLRNLKSVDLLGGTMLSLKVLRPMAEAGIEIIATRHTLTAEGIDPETFPNLRIE